jgi:hypothetical protein
VSSAGLTLLARPPSACPASRAPRRAAAFGWAAVDGVHKRRHDRAIAVEVERGKFSALTMLGASSSRPKARAERLSGADWMSALRADRTLTTCQM